MEAREIAEDTPAAKKPRCGPNAEVLQRGVVLLRGFVDQQTQRLIAEEMMAAGAAEHGFFHCNNEKTVNMEMMNLGLRMDGKPHRRRIPDRLMRLANEISGAATEADPSLPVITADVLVVNRYNPRSKLNLHEDLPTKGNRAVPVVSLSLGCAAEFIWKSNWSKKSKLKTVTLASGDCLVFGGKARGIVHGVRRIVEGTCPDYLSDIIPSNYRLNLNFRQYAWKHSPQTSESEVKANADAS